MAINRMTQSQARLYGNWNHVNWVPYKEPIELGQWVLVGYNIIGIILGRESTYRGGHITSDLYEVKIVESVMGMHPNTFKCPGYNLTKVPEGSSLKTARVLFG